ncbi:MAG: 16S rRNA (uracil(1498)-N(3))-methyltransferase [Nitrospirota bacterium]
MRIALSPEAIAQRIDISLPPDTSRYLLSVLRCSKGDRIEVIDGKGKAYDAEITGMTKREVRIAILGERQAAAEPPVPLFLCQGVLKGEKMDMVIQKATELGVKEIVPLIAERSLVRETRKVQRWGKIAEEAAEQSGRAVIPLVREPMTFAAFFSLQRAESLRGMIFWERTGLPLREALSRIALPPGSSSGDPSLHPYGSSPLHLFIGPEGGFSIDEVHRAEAQGIVPVTLGSRILRAETAAIVAVALVQFILEGEGAA